MNWDTTDHAIYPLPAEAEGNAIAGVIHALPLSLLLWYGIFRAGAWLLDAAERAIFALAGAAFVVCIGASMTAAVYWAIDLF